MFTTCFCSAQTGMLVSSFGNGGVAGLDLPNATNTFEGMTVQNDGKIVCAGLLVTHNQSDLLLARFLDNGTLDGTFGTGGMVRTDLMSREGFVAVIIQPDGKIVAAGRTGDVDETKMVVVRYWPTGDLDASFGTGGHTIIEFNGNRDYIRDIAIQADGKILGTGTFQQDLNHYVGTVFRLTTDGELDTSFADIGWTTLDLSDMTTGCVKVAVQLDGKVVVCGGFQPPLTSGRFIARYSSSGVLDPTFNGTGMVAEIGQSGINKVYTALRIQTDQRIVALGSVDGTGYSPVAEDWIPTSNLIAERFNPNGSVDGSFGSNGTAILEGVHYHDIRCAYVQPNGSIIASGYLETLELDWNVVVTKLTLSGELDTSFGTNGTSAVNLGTGLDQGYACAMASNGDVLVGGFSQNIITSAFLLRLSGDAAVNVNEVSVEPGVVAFPSPFSDHLTVRSQIAHGAIPVVHDVLGHQVAVNVARRTTNGEGQELLLTFPQELAPGIYSIQFTGAVERTMTRVVKE
ncbi:MAG: delta-60 repeat domain-containing protein [Flavobacteriales bacterium]